MRASIIEKAVLAPIKFKPHMGTMVSPCMNAARMPDQEVAGRTDMENARDPGR